MARTAVPVASDEPDAPVCGRTRLDKGDRAVGREVVDADDLKVPLGLTLDGIEAGADMALGVMEGDDDGDAGGHGFLPSYPRDQMSRVYTLSETSSSSGLVRLQMMRSHASLSRERSVVVSHPSKSAPSRVGS